MFSGRGCGFRSPDVCLFLTQLDQTTADPSVCLPPFFYVFGATVFMEPSPGHWFSRPCLKKGAASDRKDSSPSSTSSSSSFSCQGRKAGEDREGKRVISEGGGSGECSGGRTLVLNLKQLMKGIVSPLSPVSSLLSPLFTRYI